MIEPGKILQHRYRIDKQIGQGGMGAVYVATDERFGSVVAIKETLFMDDNYRKAIEREARLLNSLKHTALPRVSDHFEEENGQFIVMEYIPGEDLYAMIERSRQPFAVDDVLRWADQLLDALDYLHNQEMPVIHRDIKPQNLKLTSRGQIVLLDFGLAKGNPTDTGHQTAAKSIFGFSRNYASLEQIQGTGTDPRSDIYSLAATLYHLLTGNPPEDALTRATSVLNHRPDPLVPVIQSRPDVPKGVSGILQKALDLNAAARPRSAAEMRQMLREYNKYEGLALAVPVLPPLANPSIHSQETHLLPVVSSGGVVGDLRTGNVSQVTAFRGQNTGPGGSEVLTSVARRGGMSTGKKAVIGAASAAGLILAATAGAALLIYEPGILGTGGEAGSQTNDPAVANTEKPIDSGGSIEVPATASSTAADERPRAVNPDRENVPSGRKPQTVGPQRENRLAGREQETDPGTSFSEVSPNEPYRPRAPKPRQIPNSDDDGDVDIPRIFDSDELRELRNLKNLPANVRRNLRIVTRDNPFPQKKKPTLPRRKY